MPDGKALLRHKPHGVMAVFGLQLRGICRMAILSRR